MIQRESWCRECMNLTSSKKDILHFLAGPVPFESLPPHFQESIKQGKAAAQAAISDIKRKLRS